MNSAQSATLPSTTFSTSNPLAAQTRHYTYEELEKQLEMNQLFDWQQKDKTYREHINNCQACWSIWNKLRWEKAAKSRGLAELKEYLGHDFKPYYDSSWALVDEWERQSPETPEEVAEFYKNTHNYLYNLVIWYESGDRYRFDRDFEIFKTEYGIKTVVDYGCGVGTDGLVMAHYGLQPTFVDFECPSVDFLRWRLKKRNLDLPIVDVETLQDQLPAADMFWAIDVLEHMVDPLWTVRSLHPSTRVYVHLSQFNKRHNGRHPFHIQFREWRLSTELRRRGFKKVDWPLLSVWVREPKLGSKKESKAV